MAITPEQARVELARRELARRKSQVQPPQPGLMRRAAEAVVESPILPAAGAIAGGIAGMGAASVPLAGLGGAAGEAARQLGQRALGLEAPQTSMEAAKSIGLTGLISAGGEGLDQVAVAAVKPLALPAARRALGFASRFLKTRFAREQANNAAKVALEKDIIPILGSPEVAYQNASDLAKSVGNKIGNVVKNIEFEKIAPDAEFEIEKLRKFLTKGTNKGLLSGANQVIDSVKETVLELYGRGLTAAEYNLAKNNLAGSINFLTDSTSGSVNKRVVNNMANTIRQSVKKLLPDSFDEFVKNQKLFNAAELMKKALNDELAKQMGNNALSLPSVALGAGKVATGDVGGAAAALGLSELVKRRGLGITARGVQGLARNPQYLTAPLQAGAQSLAFGLGLGQRRRPQ